MNNNSIKVIKESIKNIPTTDKKSMTVDDMVYRKYYNDIRTVYKCLQQREDTSKLEEYQEEYKYRLNSDVPYYARKYASRSNKITYEFINDSFIINYYILNEDHSLHIGKRVYNGFDRFLEYKEISHYVEDLFELFKDDYFEYYIDGEKQSNMISNWDFNTPYYPEYYGFDKYHGIIYDAIKYYVHTKKIEAMKARNAKRDEIAKKCEKYLRAFPIKLLNDDYVLLANQKIEANSKNCEFNLTKKYVLNNGLDGFEIVDFNEFGLFLFARINKAPVDASYYPSYLNYETFADLFAVEDKLDQIEEEYNRFCFEEKALTNQELKKEVEKDKAEKVIEEKKNLEELKRKQIEELQNLIVNTLNSLNTLIDESNTEITRYPIPEELLFVEENGVKKIANKFIPNLKYLDLSNIDFKGVDISGVDFRDCNPYFIDPQIIYGKNLSNTSFINDINRINNVFPFGVNTDFNGVNLNGTNIQINSHAFMNFDGALMDDSTVINYNYPVDTEEVNKGLAMQYKKRM